MQSFADPGDGLPRNEDGSLDVPLGEGEAPVPKLPVYHEDDPNLVPAFLASEEGRDALRDIADQVKRDFDSDFESSAKFRKRVAEDFALLVGDLKPKRWPWKDAANAHVPSMLENTSRITARLESEFAGDWSNVFGVLPTGPDDEEVAQILSLHGNWQIREKLPDFRRQVSRAIMLFFVVGDVTCHSYWDPELRQNRHEMLSPDEFVVPYTQTTTMPDYGDLPHYTKVLFRYRHQLEAMKGIWSDVENVLDGRAPSFDEEPETVIRDEREKQEGIEKPDEGEAPYKLLWHETWLKLPGQDRQRWCLVILDYGSDAILNLSIHEETNWEEKARAERQDAELQMFRAAQQARAMAVAGVQQMHADLQVHPIPPEAMPAAQQAIAQAEAQVPPDPMPPLWMQNPEDPMERPSPARRDRILMFSHGVCIEPITGNLGVSLGRVQADLNRAEDTALSQFTDAATLANVKSFLTSKNVELPANTEVSPGSFIPVEGVMAGGLTDAIMPLEFGPANPQLLELVNLFYQYGQSSAQSPGVLSGEAGKSGETYRGIQTRIEQATKQLSVPGRHFCDFMRQVFLNNAKLNATYLDNEELFFVLDHARGQYKELVAGKALYQRGYRVSITADMRFSSQAQRIAEADEMLQLPRMFPPLQSNLGFQYTALVRALRARDRTDLIQYLGAPPPKTEVFGIPPPGMMPPPSPGGPPGGPPPNQGGGNQGPPPGGPQPAPTGGPPKQPGIPGPGGQLPPPGAPPG